MTDNPSAPATINPLALSNLNKSEDIDPKRIRVGLYGKAKTRKTWWAGTAGECYRTTFLDGENGSTILSNLTPEQAAHVQIIPLAGKPNQPSMALFCSLLFKARSFLWDIKDERMVRPQDIRDDRNYLDVDINRLTLNDVLVFDSWTKIASDSGISYMLQKNIDPFDGKKKDFDFYGYQDLVLDAILNGINCLPCHIIIIGHQQQYEHKTKRGIVTEKENRTQMISSTGKHAGKIPAYISDLFYFEARADDTTIYTGADDFRDGGARTIAPASKSFNTWKFKDYAAEAGIPYAKDLEWPQPQAFQFMTGVQLKEHLAANTKPAPIINTNNTGQSTLNTKGSVFGG